MTASRVFVAQQPTGRKWLVWAVLALVAAAALAWVLGWRPVGEQSGDVAQDAAEQGQRFPWNSGAAKDVFADMKAQIDAFQSSNPTEELMQSELKQAAEEMAKQVGLGPVPGPINERPPFASRIEWLTLLQVAEQAPNRQTELTRLVNELRFFKQLDLWRANLVTLTPAQRQVLIGGLLNEIPDRVAKGVMDIEEARTLQREMVYDLLSDPGQRAQRLEQEGARLKPPAPPAAEASAAGA